MNTDTLNLLDAVVVHGSFADAARVLEVDPSAVSRGVAQLERELGFRLFERSTRKISLTEAGAHYHVRVAPLLADLADAEDTARDLVTAPTGVLRVSASTAFGQRVLLPVIDRYLRDYPDVRVELHLSDAPVDLIAERIDIAIRLTPDASPDTIVSRLIDTQYRVVAAPSFLERHTVSHPSDLSGLPCLLFPFPGFRDLWLFRNAREEISVPISGRLEILGALALRDAALAGIGPALLADWLIGGDLEAGDLVDLLPDYQVAAGRFDTAAWILTPSRRYRPLKVRHFIDRLRANLRP
ncbi:MAG: LysR family transcriptional regulator [Rhodobacteraceae bacterium]|nr:LysR family transcriptional regulator [Paracoccaceae bacterium]